MLNHSCVPNVTTIEVAAAEDTLVSLHLRQLINFARAHELIFSLDGLQRQTESCSACCFLCFD